MCGVSACQPRDRILLARIASDKSQEQPFVRDGPPTKLMPASIVRDHNEMAMTLYFGNK
jgi:hypothetical protein